MNQPFYDPLKTYEENLTDGPFGEFANGKVYKNVGEPKYTVFGLPVFLPFGIPAGPLINGKFVKSALDKGFDLVIYKTVRTRKYAVHDWPNVVALKIRKDLTLEKAKKGLVAEFKYEEPVSISITNSFGVPSKDPDFWQKDLKDAIEYAKNGQVVIGSFQGTKSHNHNMDAFINDFTFAAKLVKETGVKVMEVNLSCPNEGHANLICFDISTSQNILYKIKNEIGNTPLIVKISYFHDDEHLKLFVKTIGSLIDGIAAINTIPAKVVDEKGKQALPGEGREISGVCGHAIQWAGLEMTERLKKIREELGLSYTIIGVGGVTKPEDYTLYRNVGADIVMSATGAMWHPDLAIKIKENL